MQKRRLIKISTREKLDGLLQSDESYEHTFQRKDKSIFSALLHQKLLRDSKGEIIGIRTTIQDISVRKKNEIDLHETAVRLEQTLTELQETQKMALHQERMRALGQIASGIAHDINNSLAPIIGYTELLLEYENLNEKIRSKLSSMILLLGGKNGKIP
jgi:C4-dicarboxylate-specific signal transduction histidine kinase